MTKPTQTTNLRDAQYSLWESLNQLINTKLVQKTKLKNKEFYFTEPDGEARFRKVIGINIIDSRALVMLQVYDEYDDDEYDDDDCYQYDISDFKFEEVCDLVDALIGQ